MEKVITTLFVLTLISCTIKTNKNPPDHPVDQKGQEKQTIVTNQEEEFQEISSDYFNQLLNEKGESLSAEEVMRLFYPYRIETSEGNEKIELSKKVSDNGNVVVTLIHDNQLDDSVRGEKYVMSLARINNKWTVLSIKTNWRCWDGRGHSDWGIERCY